MAFRRSRRNIRRAPVRRRRTYTRRRTVTRRRAPSTNRAVNRAKTPCRCPGELDPGQKFVAVQADPFEPKFAGGKVPDSSTIPSIAAPVTYNRKCNSLAASQPLWAQCYAFYPSFEAEHIQALGVDATTWTWVGATVNAHPQATNVDNQFEVYRPVAHAIRVSSPLAPTSTTGFVHIALVIETGFSAAATGGSQYLQLPTTLDQMSGYAFYKRVTLASLTQSPITLINKWTDETAFRYSSPFANPISTGGTGGPTMANQFHIPLSWGTLLIAVEGASTSTTPGSVSFVQCEVVTHIEGIPQRGSPIIGSTAAPYSSSTLNAVSQAVANTDFSHNEDQQDSTISSYMTELINAAGNNPHIRQIGERLAGMAMRGVASWAAGHVGGVGDVANPNRLLQY